MQVGDIRNPADRNKIILAGALGLVAILFLWWTFFGFGGSSNSGPPRTAGQPTPAARPGVTTPRNQPQTVVQFQEINATVLGPVVSRPPVSAPEAGRNIFAFYEPQPKKEVQIPVTPTPTPTPTPPVLLASISPSNVFARAASSGAPGAGYLIR